MINFDDLTKENKIEHNPNWLQISDHPHRILTSAGSVSENTNILLLNLAGHHPRIAKNYLHVKDLYEAKYESFINKSKKMGPKYFQNPKPFIEYSNDIKQPKHKGIKN